MILLNNKGGNRRSLEAREEIEKKPMWPTIKRLAQYGFSYKLLVFLALILTLGSNIFSLLGPRFSGFILDAIQPGRGQVAFDRVFHYALLLVGFYIISAIASYIQQLIMVNMSRKIVYKMRTDVFAKILRLPISFFDKNQSGDIISRLSYDIDSINSTLASDVIQILSTIVTVVGAFTMMVAISWELMLIFVVTIPLALITTRVIASKTRPLFKERSIKLGALNGFTEEMITGITTLKAYNQEEETLEKFDNVNKEAQDTFYKAEYYGSMSGPSISFINNLSNALISTLGALFFLAGRISVGDISAFILYSRKFSGPINEVANMVADFQSSLAAAQRVFDLLDEPEEAIDSDNAVTLDDIHGEVKLDNVYFGYNVNQYTIKDIDIHAHDGQTIAIVGPTGSGKSTIVNLLMRFYEANKGQITIDGLDITDITKDSLRKSFAMVTQDTWLFYGTIYDNLIYGNEKATKKQVIEACKACGIHKFIMSLPDDYNTILTEEGNNISKGQKQLFTIVRAMLQDAKILILDEATSNIDTRTEKLIQDAMEKLMEGKTCFIIAHRLSTIENADEIIVINNGEIEETGTHQELLDKKGFYYKLYEAQFS